MTIAHARRRAKGSAFVRIVREFLERRWECAVRGVGEDGDDIRIFDFPWLSIECKNHSQLDLGGWMRQAKAQANGKLPVVIHKRWGNASPESQWVTMELETFVQILVEAQK